MHEIIAAGSSASKQQKEQTAITSSWLECNNLYKTSYYLLVGNEYRNSVFEFILDCKLLGNHVLMTICSVVVFVCWFIEWLLFIMLLSLNTLLLAACCYCLSAAAFFNYRLSVKFFQINVLWLVLGSNLIYF